MKMLFIILWLVTFTVLAVEISTPPQARDYCPVEPYFRNSQPCPRIPTEAVPLCPHPQGYGIKGMVDSSVAYLKDSTGKILTW